ncbi:MAG: stage II sporulation protein R [Christensenellaceae bacterium]|jgi:stage II sporulation protein R|nr:stage II sporulation protein R [Christensenellaceae bacterium]
MRRSLWAFAPQPLGRKLLLRALLAFVAFALLSLALYFLGGGHKTALATAIESGELLRLHILANDDGAAAQETKLYVRDRVLEALSPALSAAGSEREAEALTLANLDLALNAARAAALERGFAGEISAAVGSFPFPDRTYAGHLVPAGDYRALRIVLGEGKGQNWWCVMYPPLCFVGEDAVEPDAVRFESAIGNWFKQAKQKWDEKRRKPGA